VQMVPVLPKSRPQGYGHLEYQSFTCDGRTPQVHFQNAVVYTDGSCSKMAHPSMHLAGWSVISLTPNGNLAAAVWGQVGESLPQSSPASEYVAGMAAVELHASQIRTDFKGLASLESSPHAALASRKNLYSGLRVQMRGRSPQTTYSKVEAHLDPSSFTVGSESWIDAVGNKFADAYAKLGAGLHPQASAQEVATVIKEREVLLRFLLYVSRALALWDPVGPTTGTRKNLIPKLPARPDLVPGAGGRSFASDVLGPWAPTATSASSSFGDSAPHAPPPPLPEDPAPRRRLRGKQAPAIRVRGGVPPKGGHHEWRFRRDHWICTSCLKVSRATAPSRTQRCPGFNAVMSELLHHPQGHALSYSSFLDLTGIMVLCTKCGGHCSSNRRARTLSAPCLGKPSSAGSGAALARMCKMQHPVHARGDSVVFDAWRPLSDLLGH
jgi:hypothetical protein